MRILQGSAYFLLFAVITAALSIPLWISVMLFSTRLSLILLVLVTLPISCMGFYYGYKGVSLKQLFKIKQLIAFIKGA